MIIYADKQQYLPNLQLQLDQAEHQGCVEQYHLYEIKSLEDILPLDHNQKAMIDNTKRIRSHMAKKISQLNNLVGTIDKAHKAGDEKKILISFEKYKATKQMALKLKPVVDLVKKKVKKQEEIKEDIHLDNKNTLEEEKKKCCEESKKNSNSLFQFFQKHRGQKGQEVEEVKGKEQLSQKKKKKEKTTGDQGEQLLKPMKEAQWRLLEKNRQLVKEFRLVEGEDLLQNLRQMGRLQRKFSGTVQKGLEEVRLGRRKAVVFMGDSVRKSRNQVIDHACKHISARHPFRKEDNIDYDIDTEDQLEEELAEDLNEDDKEEEQEEEEEDNQSFLVPDGYLSADEQSEKNSWKANNN